MPPISIPQPLAPARFGQDILDQRSGKFSLAAHKPCSSNDHYGPGEPTRWVRNVKAGHYGLNSGTQALGDETREDCVGLNDVAGLAFVNKTLSIH
jgi:hypothetical protein